MAKRTIAKSVGTRATEAAERKSRTGFLAQFDRLPFAWGWAEGYRAARRVKYARQPQG